MIIDGRTLPDGHQLQADLCIVGSGPAGLTVAHELRNSGLSICLVESGPPQPEERYERLNDAEAVDSDLEPAIDTRARAFGGSSHRWSLFSGGFGPRVRMLPFSPIDFEGRDWVPDSGWPFSADDLEPFQHRARAIAGLPAHVASPELAATAERPLLPLDPTEVRTAMEWFAEPRRFSEELPGDLGRHSAVTVVTHSTAVSVASNDDGASVSGVDLRTLTGQRLSVAARRVVVATGGIENARLLLASRDGHPDGLGNEHDVVGRYYMDHLKLVVGDFVPVDPALFDRMGFYDIHRVDDALLTGKLQLSDAAQRNSELLNAAVRFEPRPSEATLGATHAGHRLLSDLRHGRPRARSFLDPLRELRGFPALGRLGFELAVRQRQALPSVTHGWSRVARPSRHYTRFQLELQLELAPDRTNRVTLSEQRDALGQPRAAIRWRKGELERRTIRGTIERLEAEFARAGLGAVTLRAEDDFDVVTPPGDNHPTGTTRIHRDPRLGVVDEDCRVHGVQNLYVTGSSVFPTSGYANPTLTIIAMAARLADHLSQSR